MEILSGAFPEIGTVPEVFFTESLAQSLYLNNTFTLVICTKKIIQFITISVQKDRVSPS